MLKRILTALVLIPIVLLLVLKLPHAEFGFFAGAVCLLAGWEWAGLCHFQLAGKLIFSALLILCGLILYWLQTPWIWLVGVALWVIASYWVMTYRGNAPTLLQKPLTRAAVGLLLLPIAWHAFYSLDGMGKHTIILLFLLVWPTDIFAYFVGKKWGKHPLIPLVSPKKTIEGFCGGLIGSLLIAGLCQAFYPLTVSVPVWLSIALLTCLISVMGDLFESLIKRIAGVKDSGSLLPGHGGVLDRIDSLLAALPLFAWCLQWVGGI